MLIHLDNTENVFYLRIIEKNCGRAPFTYHQFQAIIASLESPPPAEPTITVETGSNANTPIDEDHDEKYGVPTLEELGFDTDGLKPPVWIGGETEALARLERHLERKAWVASFGRPKMTPQSLLASQTGLSPYLRFGCLSTRLFYYQLTGIFVALFYQTFCLLMMLSTIHRSLSKNKENYAALITSWTVTLERIFLLCCN